MNRANLLNAALLQLLWFACVLGGAADSVVWGALVLGALVVFAAARDRPFGDLGFLAAALAAGLLLDTLWIRTGILDYGDHRSAPGWILMLWAGVGLSLNHSLSLFAYRPWLGGALASAVAPFSYLTGARFGAVVVPDVEWLAIVAIAWFIVFAVAFHRVAPRGTVARAPFVSTGVSRNES